MNTLKWYVATVVGFISAWLIGLPTAIKLMLILMGLDYATGVIVAIMHRKLSSAVGYEGLWRKALMMILVVAAHALTHAAEIGFDLGSATAMFFSVNELVSIIENCERGGVRIPPILLQTIEKVQAITGGEWKGTERRVESKEFDGNEKRKP